MNHETTTSDTNPAIATSDPTELSIADLDQVSGGVDLVISGSFFEQNEIAATQTGGCGTGGSSSISASNTSSGTFQIAGLGFESASEIFAVFSGLSRLFGR